MDTTHRFERALRGLRRRSEELKRRSDELEDHSAELARRADTVRHDWERKRADPGVPGAQPDRDDDGSGADSVGPGADRPEARDRGS